MILYKELADKYVGAMDQLIMAMEYEKGFGQDTIDGGYMQLLGGHLLYFTPHLEEWRWNPAAKMWHGPPLNAVVGGNPTREHMNRA